MSFFTGEEALDYGGQAKGAKGSTGSRERLEWPKLLSLPKGGFSHPCSRSDIKAGTSAKSEVVLPSFAWIASLSQDNEGPEPGEVTETRFQAFLSAN